MAHEATLPRNCSLEVNHIQVAGSLLCSAKCWAPQLSDPIKKSFCSGSLWFHGGNGVSALRIPAVHWVWVCVHASMWTTYVNHSVLCTAQWIMVLLRSQVPIGNLSLRWESSMCKQAIYHEPYKDTLTPHLQISALLFTFSRSSAHILPLSVYGRYVSFLRSNPKHVWRKLEIHKWTSHSHRCVLTFSKP